MVIGDIIEIWSFFARLASFLIDLKIVLHAICFWVVYRLDVFFLYSIYASFGIPISDYSYVQIFCPLHFILQIFVAIELKS